MGGEFRGEWIQLRMAESLPCSSETVKTRLIAYTPRQNKKVFKKREREQI